MQNGLANGRHGTRPRPGTGGHDSSTARSVYGFLTSFTQGVQRGLDETRSDPNSPEGESMTLSDEARNFNWLLNSFVDQTAGVTDAVAVSSDGLLMAASSSLDRASAEQLAAIISGFVSLGHGASRCFDFAGLEQIIVAMRQGFLFVSSISDGSCLGVVATRNCDIGLVGYQTTLLVERAGQVLSPALVAELKAGVVA